MKWISIGGVDSVSRVVNGVHINYPVGVAFLTDDETAKDFINSGIAKEVEAPKEKKVVKKGDE